MVTRNWIVLVVALVGALCAVPDLAIAQAADAQSAKDLQELRDYKLTMAVLERVATAKQAAALTMSKDPKRQRLAKQKAELAVLEAKEEPTEAEYERMDALADEILRFEDVSEGDDDRNDSVTISGYARRIDATPSHAAAVRSVGLSSREFATATLALLQAVVAHGLMKQKLLKQPPPEVSKHNLEFVRIHEKEIAALGILAQDGG